MRPGRDQREWLYREEQERLRLRRRMDSARRRRGNWAAVLLGLAFVVILAVVVISSEIPAELLSHFGR